MTIKELFAPADMTEGKPWEKIVIFTIPMLIGNIAQQLYNTVGSCSADDRIIDHDDTFAINNLSDRIQLDLYTAFPVFLFWLDKGSSNIGILYKSSIIRNT